MVDQAEQPVTSDYNSWEQEVADLLSMLSHSQEELLNLLVAKREVLLASDTGALPALQQREEEVVEKLKACQQRRSELLSRAGSEGLPSDSLLALSDRLPAQSQAALKPRLHDAKNRARILQHHSLTNWVLVQRTLLHLSQILEIIATGGEQKPTYGNEKSDAAGGSLLDQAV